MLLLGILMERHKKNLRYFFKNTPKNRTNNKRENKTEKNYFSDEIGKQNEKKVVAESETKIDVTKMYLVSRIVQNCTIENAPENEQKENKTFCAKIHCQPMSFSFQS